MLDDVVTFVEEENMVQVVIDNATNYKVAREMLMRKKNLYWTPFAAHYIDLILEDFEKKAKGASNNHKERKKIYHLYLLENHAH